MATDAPELKLTEEQFDYMLSGVVANEKLAFEAAKGLSIFSCCARDIARQMRMNQMVENQIISLMEMTNTTIAYTQSQSVNQIPFPPHVNVAQSLINFRNHR